MYPFNVRVYGILTNEYNEVLISDEKVNTFEFTKFPGGGLEYGEGLIDALRREFTEECGITIDVIKHVYTTDFFEKSSFNESQIISVYYYVTTKDEINLEKINVTAEAEYAHTGGNKTQKFKLVPIIEMSEDLLTFKTDKIGWKYWKAENAENG